MSRLNPNNQPTSGCWKQGNTIALPILVDMRDLQALQLRKRCVCVCENVCRWAVRAKSRYRKPSQNLLIAAIEVGSILHGPFLKAFGGG